ncbi:MAG: PAS domain S-box protein [Ardenticatenaceae bacterium]|nr:PAS domain S-box protein [Ardenticatenaceae bacterium]
METAQNATTTMIMMKGRVASWEWIPQDNPIYWSPFVAQVIGQNEGIDISTWDGFTEVVHPDDRSTFKATLEQALQTDQPLVADLRVQNHKGRTLWVNITGVPYFKNDGRVQRYIGTLRLLSQEQELRYQIESSPDPLITYDAEGNVTYINSRFSEVFGWKLEEIFGRPLAFVPDNRQAELQEMGQIAIQTGRLEGFETQRLTKDGQLLDVEISARDLTNEDGDRVGMFILLRDITERKGLELELMGYRAELEQMVDARTIELKQSEKRLTDLIDQSPQAIIEWNQDFVVTGWNQAAEKTFGYSAKEAIGQHAKFILEEEVWPLVDQIFQHLLSLEGGEHSVNRNVHHDGSVITCEWYNKTLTDEAGQVTGVLSFVSDITDKQQLERERAFQAMTLDQVGEAIINCNLNFVVRSWNKGAEKLYGFTAEEVIGKSLTEFVPETLYDHYHGEIGLKMLHENGQMSDTATQTLRDGREIRIETTGTMYFDENGNPEGIVAINRDITAIEEERRDIAYQSQLIRLVLDNVPQAVFWKDTNSAYLGSNKHFAQAAGFTNPDDLIGKDDHELPWKPEETAAFIADDKAVMESGRPKLGIVEPQLQADGNQTWLETNKIPLRDETGQVIGVLGTFQDVTQRRAAEVQTQYQASLLEYTSDAIVALDKELKIQTWNRAAEEMYGYKADEVLGHPLSEVLSTEYYEFETSEVRSIVLKNGSLQGRAIQKTKNGRELLIDASLAAILDANGDLNGFVAINRDVTAEQEAQAQVEYQASLLDTVSEAIVASDVNFDVQYWNPAAFELYDLTPEEIKGKSVGDLLQTEYIGHRPGEVLEILRRDGKFAGRAIQKTVKGKELIIDASLAILNDSSGKFLAYVGVNRDVTKQVAADAERIRLNTILENTTDFVGVYNPQGEIVFLNKAGRDMVGVPFEKDLEANLSQFISEPFQQKVQDGINFAIEHGSWNGELELLSTTGETIPVSQVIMAHKESGEDVSFISTIARDISQQKNQERQTLLRMRLSRQLSDAKNIDDVLMAIESFGAIYPDVTLSMTKKLPQTNEGGQIHRLLVLNYQGEQEDGETIPVGVDLTYEDALAKPLDQGEMFITANMEADERLNKLTRDFAIRNQMRNTVLFPIMLDSETRFGALTVSSHLIGYFNQEIIGQYQTLVEEITLTIRSIQLNEEVQRSLERRSQEVAITTRIAQEIATADNLLEIYEQVVIQVKESFDFYHTQILQYNPALDAVSLVVGYGEIGEKMAQQGHKMPLGDGLIGTAAATGLAVLRPDVRQDPSWQPNPNLPDTRGELAIPIKFQDEILGVLDIQTDQANVLSESDQVVLEGLCGVIAVAVESTRLRQDMATRLEELDTLQRSLSREGWQAMQYMQTMGYMYDQTDVRPLHNESGSTVDSNPLTSSLDSLLTHPLAIRGEQIGTLALQELEEQPLTEEDQQLLSEITIQVSEALENARLFEQTQRRAAELETVAELSTTTATILEQEKLLKSVADLTKEGFGLEHVNIYLHRPEDEALQLVAGSGQVGELLVTENISVPLDGPDTIPLQVFKSRQPLITNNLDQQAHPFLKAVRSILAAPLMAGGENMGVIGLMSANENAFSPTDLSIFTTLANQVASALQNATLYQEQKDTAEKLIEVDRLKSEFLASMSHELRTPLNSIIGFADVLLEGIDGDLNDRMREDVLLIRDGGRHLRNLIGEILDMSKIEAGMMELSYGQVDIQRVAKEVLATTNSLITEKPITVIENISEDIEMIEADRTRLIQILLNLLSNAVKFTDEGSITLSMERNDENQEMLVKVQDTGVGIKEEDIDLVFAQFRQVGGMEHRKAGGTGLGMPITMHLVELHGGKIWLESVYGVGSTFYFTIPYSRPTDVDKEGQRYYA